MSDRVLVLGAGFGGLELCTILSDALGEDAGVTLIDSGDAFVFGYSKLDLMFGRTTPDAIRLPYRDPEKPGVRFLQETSRRSTRSTRPPGEFHPPSEELRGAKERFGSSRRERWFGLAPA